MSGAAPGYKQRSTACLVVDEAPLLSHSSPLAADTGAFPLAYCTALPRLTFEHWERDYAKYSHFLTPDIKRTQTGMAFTNNGVRTWWCYPSATPHAQLDTLTRLASPYLAEGRWKSVLFRSIVHRDSAVFAEKKFYRSASASPINEDAELLLAEGKITLKAGKPGSGKALEKIARKKYAIVSGRYLLMYGLSKSGAAVSQVGVDKQGRLLLHSCIVRERQVKGEYLTYETVINQTIFERQQ